MTALLIIGILVLTIFTALVLWIFFIFFKQSKKNKELYKSIVSGITKKISTPLLIVLFISSTFGLVGGIFTSIIANDKYITTIMNENNIFHGQVDLGATEWSSIQKRDLKTDPDKLNTVSKEVWDTALENYSPSPKPVYQNYNTWQGTKAMGMTQVEKLMSHVENNIKANSTGRKATIFQSLYNNKNYLGLPILSKEIIKWNKAYKQKDTIYMKHYVTYTLGDALTSNWLQFRAILTSNVWTNTKEDNDKRWENYNDDNPFQVIKRPSKILDKQYNRRRINKPRVMSFFKDKNNKTEDDAWKTIVLGIKNDKKLIPVSVNHKYATLNKLQLGKAYSFGMATEQFYLAATTESPQSPTPIFSLKNLIVDVNRQSEVYINDYDFATFFPSSSSTTLISFESIYNKTSSIFDFISDDLKQNLNQKMIAKKNHPFERGNMFSFLQEKFFKHQLAFNNGYAGTSAINGERVNFYNFALITTIDNQYISLIIAIILATLFILILLFVFALLVKSRVKASSKQFGVLKAMGISKETIAASYIMFPIALLLLGFLISVPIALFIHWFFTVSSLDSWSFTNTAITFEPITMIITFVIPLLLFITLTFLIALLILRKSAIDLIQNKEKNKPNFLVKSAGLLTGHLNSFSLSYKIKGGFRAIGKSSLLFGVILCSVILISMSISLSNYIDNLISRSMKSFNFVESTKFSAKLNPVWRTVDYNDFSKLPNSNTASGLNKIEDSSNLLINLTDITTPPLPNTLYDRLKNYLNVSPTSNIANSFIGIEDSFRLVLTISLVDSYADPNHIIANPIFDKTTSPTPERAISFNHIKPLTNIYLKRILLNATKPQVKKHTIRLIEIIKIFLDKDSNLSDEDKIKLLKEVEEIVKKLTIDILPQFTMGFGVITPTPNKQPYATLINKTLYQQANINGFDKTIEIGPMSVLNNSKDLEELLIEPTAKKAISDLKKAKIPTNKTDPIPIIMSKISLLNYNKEANKNLWVGDIIKEVDFDVFGETYPDSVWFTANYKIAGVYDSYLPFGQFTTKDKFVNHKSGGASPNISPDNYKWKTTNDAKLVKNLNILDFSPNKWISDSQSMAVAPYNIIGKNFQELEQKRRFIPLLSLRSFKNAIEKDTITRGKDIEFTARNLVEGVYDGGSFILLREMFESQSEAIKDKLGTFIFIFYSFSMMIGIMLIVISMKEIIDETRREISMLKAFGYSDRKSTNLVITPYIFIMIIAFIIAAPLSVFLLVSLGSTLTALTGILFTLDMILYQWFAFSAVMIGVFILLWLIVYLNARITNTLEAINATEE